jgi:hypothetical protein|tara:strand:- start:10 stop:462 length:453 start_codon:yes stop_codon:yes gene_type:complete
MSFLKRLYKINKEATKLRYKENPLRAGLTDIASTGALVGGGVLLSKHGEKSRQKQAVTMDYLYRHKDIIEPTIAQYGDGDIGYSIGALRVAANNNIIKPDMSVKEVAEIMKRENLAPYGFKLDESILNEVFNPFTKDLPQGDTMGTGDFS